MNRTAPTRPAPGRPAPSRPGSATARRHATRQQREQRKRLAIVGGVALALLVVIVVPVIGYYREVLTKGEQAVARVDGETVTLDQFAKLYGYRLVSLDRQLAQMRQLATGQNAAAFGSEMQRLESQRESLDSSVLDELVEQRINAKEAAARGITVTEADEQARIERDFGSPPVPTPTAPPDATPGPAPTAVATVAPIDRFKNAIDGVKVIDQESYRQLVLRPELVSERLQDSFAAEVPPTELQIHARRMLLESEDAAKAAKERIDKGEPFDKLATELSKDQDTKDKGGDLGWFGKGKLTQPVEEAAFALNANQVTDPVRSAFGWELIQVLEKDESHPLDDTQKTDRRNKLYKDWLEGKKDEGFRTASITYDWGSDKLNWAKQQVNKAQGLPKNAP